MSKTNENNHGRRDFLKLGATALAGVAYLSAAGRADAARGVRASSSPEEDTPNTHNMLVVGEQTVFLSHLPMFVHMEEMEDPKTHKTMKVPMRAHRYQAIFEVTFTRPSRLIVPPDLQRDYAEDRRRHKKTRIYTLNPTEEFVLSTLAPPNPSRTSFPATIFRGHLEKGGVSIFEDALVGIRRVVHFREFDTTAPRPSRLQYILFGKGQELFMAHFISSPPDFDHVLSVRLPGAQFSDEDLAKGLRVVFPDRANSIPARIREGQQLAAEITLPGATTPKKTQLAAISEFYFEEGELRQQPSFDTTRAEAASHFR